MEKQILELGGKTIQDECKEEKKRGTFTYGKVCKTTAGQLQCRKIYHIALYEEWISKCKLSLEVWVQKTNAKYTSLLILFSSVIASYAPFQVHADNKGIYIIKLCL